MTTTPTTSTTVTDADADAGTVLVPVVMRLADGRRVNTAGEATATAGLLVAPNLGPAGRFDGRWTVLHQPSGRPATLALPTLAQARTLAALLGTLAVDWTAPAHHLLAGGAVLTHQVREVFCEAAYTTSTPKEDDVDDY